MRAIREHIRDFIAIIALVAAGLVTAYVILNSQATALPSWVPLAGPHGEFELVFTVPRQRAAELRGLEAAIGRRFLRLGHVRRGEGVRMGGARVDGAAIRDLAATHGQDPRRYLEALRRITPAGPSEGSAAS